MSCITQYNQYEVIGCRNGVAVTKKVVYSVTNNNNQIVTFSDGGTITTPTPWTPGECSAIPETRYDWETLCDSLTGMPVSVRFEYLTDGTVSPATMYNIDGTAYAGTYADLTACGTSKKYDYEDIIVYDNCNPVLQTIVRETGVSNAIHVIYYTELDGTAHTLIGPITDKPCSSANPLSIGSESLSVAGLTTLTPTAGSKYAVISVITGEVWITVDGATPVVGASHPAYEGQYVYLQIENEIIDFQCTGTATLFITYYDKPLLLSQQ